MNKNAMTNRRNYYRHHFTGPDRLWVLLEPSLERHPFQGEIIDLSVDGMRVRLASSASSPALDSAIIARPCIPAMEVPLGMNARVVYDALVGNQRDLGLQFLSSANPALDEKRQNVIWHYLLDQQRRTLRARREGAVTEVV